MSSIVNSILSCLAFSEVAIERSLEYRRVMAGMLAMNDEFFLIAVFRNVEAYYGGGCAKNVLGLCLTSVSDLTETHEKAGRRLAGASSLRETFEFFCDFIKARRFLGAILEGLEGLLVNFFGISQFLSLLRGWAGTSKQG